MVQELQAFRVGWVGMENEKAEARQAPSQLQNGPEESIVRFIKTAPKKTCPKTKIILTSEFGT